MFAAISLPESVPRPVTGPLSRPVSLAPRPRSGLERSESFSSAGEDEEEDEDQFEILTAESLFTTLLDRVRNLTRRVSTEDSPLKVRRVSVHSEADGSKRGRWREMGFVRWSSDDARKNKKQMFC